MFYAIYGIGAGYPDEQETVTEEIVSTWASIGKAALNAFKTVGVSHVEIYETVDEPHGLQLTAEVQAERERQWKRERLEKEAEDTERKEAWASGPDAWNAYIERQARNKE